MNIARLMSLRAMSDREIMQWAANNGVELSLKEIQILRKTLEKGSIDWLVNGVPDKVLYKLNQTIGEKKLNKLMKLL